MGLLDMLGAGLDDPRNIAALRMGGLISQGAIGQTRPQSLFGLLGQGAGAYSDTMRQARADELRSQEAQMRKDEFGLRRQQYEQELAAAQEQRQMAERQQQAASDWLMNFRTGAYGNHLEAAQDAAFRGISEVPSVKAALSTLAPPDPIKFGRDDRLAVPDGQGGFKTVLDALPKEPKLPTIAELQNYRDSLPPGDPRASEVQRQIDAIGRGNSISIQMPTESESKAGTLGTRLQVALDQIANVVGASGNYPRPEWLPETLRDLPIIGDSTLLQAFANSLTSAQRQRIENAQLDALDAALTLGTGAAYTREQIRNYAQSYFPQIGDSDETIRDKNERFAKIVQAARLQAGRAGYRIDQVKAAPNPLGVAPEQSVLQSAQGPQSLKRGDVVDGWRFLGGDPKNKMNWTRVAQ